MNKERNNAAGFKALVTIAVMMAFPSLSVGQNMRRMLFSELPKSTPMVHDPVMAYDGATYHLFATGRGIEHMTSENMEEWTRCDVPVMSVIPRWVRDSVPAFRDHVWAPDITYHDGRWWLAYSCSTFGRNTSAIGLLSTRELVNGAIWNDEGPIICSREGRDNWNAIDPNIVIDTGGRPWLAFGSFWDGVRIVPLDSTMHRSGETARTIARRDTLGHDNAIEAPFVFRHGEYYYLFVSWDHCCRGMRSDYKVVVGRSHDVAGPYLDREGRDMASGGGTLVIEGDKEEYVAAGHCAVYTFAGTDWFICHGYSVEHGGVSVLIRQQIAWDADGWPTIKPQEEGDQ